MYRNNRPKNHSRKVHKTANYKNKATLILKCTSVCIAFLELLHLIIYSHKSNK